MTQAPNSSGLRGRQARPSRGQAAIFDGIMFMLIASISVTMVYSFLSSYGVAQDNVLLSSYQIAYLDSVGKAIYYIDAPALAQAAPAGSQITNFQDADYCKLHPSQCSANNGVGQPYYDLGNNGQLNCSLLAQYPEQTVADLLKKDLGDAPGINDPVVDENTICLDNRYGVDTACTTPGSPPVPSSLPVVPGKLALRCALVELMTPFHSAGYRYFADFLKETTPGGVPGTVPQQNPNPGGSGGPDGWQRITDSYVADANAYSSCEDVANKYGDDTALTPVPPGTTLSVDLLSTSTPFRIPRGETIDTFFAQTMRICVWKSQLGGA